MYEQIEPVFFSCTIEVDRYDIIRDDQQKGGLSSFLAEITGNQYVQYTLEIQPSIVRTHYPDPWRIQVRFSDLHDLHSILVNRYDSLPDFPQKSATRRFDGQFLEQRAINLRTYFDALVQRQDVMSAPEVLQFLKLKTNLSYNEVSRFTNNLPRLKTQVAVGDSQKRNKNLVDFIYSPKNSLLLVASSDKENLENYLNSLKNNVTGWIIKDSNEDCSSSLSLWVNREAILHTSVSNGDGKHIAHSGAAQDGIGQDQSLFPMTAKQGYSFENVWTCDFGSQITCIAGDIDSYYNYKKNGTCGDYPDSYYYQNQHYNPYDPSRADILEHNYNVAASSGQGTNCDSYENYCASTREVESFTENNGSHIFCGLANGQIGWRRLNDVVKTANPDYKQFLLPGVNSESDDSTNKGSPNKPKTGNNGSNTTPTQAGKALPRRTIDSFCGVPMVDDVTKFHPAPKTGKTVTQEVLSKVAQTSLVVTSAVASTAATTVGNTVQSVFTKTTAAVSAKQAGALYSSSKCISALAYDSQYALLFFATRDSRIAMYSLSTLKIVSEISLNETGIGTYATKLELDREHNRLLALTSSGGLFMLEFGLQKVTDDNLGPKRKVMSGAIPGIFRLHGYIGQGDQKPTEQKEEAVWCKGVLYEKFHTLIQPGGGQNPHVTDFLTLPEGAIVDSTGRCKMENYELGKKDAPYYEVSHGDSSCGESDLSLWDANENCVSSFQSHREHYNVNLNKRGGRRGRKQPKYELGTTIQGSTTLLLACKEGLTFFRIDCSTKESTGSLVIPPQGKRLGDFFGRTKATTVSFASNSAEIIAGFADGSISIYDFISKNHNCCFTAVEGRKAVNKLFFNNRSLLSAGRDGLLKFWDFPSSGGSLSSFLQTPDDSGNNCNPQQVLMQAPQCRSSSSSSTVPNTNYIPNRNYTGYEPTFGDNYYTSPAKTDASTRASSSSSINNYQSPLGLRGSANECGNLPICMTQNMKDMDDRYHDTSYGDSTLLRVSYGNPSFQPTYNHTTSLPPQPPYNHTTMCHTTTCLTSCDNYPSGQGDYSSQQNIYQQHDISVDPYQVNPDYPVYDTNPVYNTSGSQNLYPNLPSDSNFGYMGGGRTGSAGSNKAGVSRLRSSDGSQQASSQAGGMQKKNSCFMVDSDESDDDRVRFPKLG